MESDTELPFQRIIERLELCTYAVQEAHYEIEPPTDPEQKADLLLAVEHLTTEVMELLKTTKYYVWGEPLFSNQDQEEEEEED